MDEPLVQNPVAIFLTIVAVILLAPMLFERFRLPGIVGLIIGGIIIGPHVLHLLSADFTMETLGMIGLVYLMFSVGLEIEFKQFRRVRNEALVLGIFTFMVPEIVGIITGRWLGFSWNSSVLLGAVVASHALINYPLLNRLGILRNDAVAATMGATVFTDLLALLVLAYVVRVSGGDFTPWGIFLLIVSMLAYISVVLVALPRLGKLFFRRFTGRSVEFQFILLILFFSALVAELVGLHVIIGAFLAGLAINSTLPSRSPVVNRVLFLGESLFIPIFLIYVGMILDPGVLFTEPSSLLAGGILLSIVYLSKLVPAWAASGIFGYNRDELITIWGITQAQATTTLAVLLVGTDMELITSTFFNGGIMMVMVTCITSSIIVQRFGSRLLPSKVPRDEGKLFERILVATANPSTHEYLLGLAGVLARTADGELLPLYVTLHNMGECLWEEDLGERLEGTEELDDPETKTELIHRVDTSVPDGIMHAAMERKATMIVMGWHGEKAFRYSAFGTVVDQVLLNAEIPVLVGRMITSVNALKRLVLVVPAGSVMIGSLQEVMDVISALASAINVPLVVLSDEDYLSAIRGLAEQMSLEPQPKVFKLGRNAVRDAASRTSHSDLIVVTTIISRLRFGSSLGRIPEQLADESDASLAVVVFPS